MSLGTRACSSGSKIISCRVLAAEDGDWERLALFPGVAPFFGSPCLVAWAGFTIAGCLAYRRVAEHEVEVLYLETSVSFRRMGIARALLRVLKEQNPGSVFLEVRESNASALKLYQSEGFSETSRRVGYYHAPEESAIVLGFHSC